MKKQKLKMKKAGAAFLISLMALAAIVGCEEDNPVVPPRPPWTLVRIIAEDTLRYVPGDSATTPVTIIVENGDGNVLPGRIVNFGLDSSRRGFLQPINPAQGDTTDELGRLQLLFTSVGEPGKVRIYAACDGVTAMDSIVILADSTHSIDTLWIDVDPDSIHYLLMDSVLATAFVGILPEGIGLPNVQLIFQITGGYISLSPVIDPAGYTHCVWHLPHQTGTWCIRLNAENRTDSACVWVEP